MMKADVGISPVLHEFFMLDQLLSMPVDSWLGGLSSCFGIILDYIQVLHLLLK